MISCFVIDDEQGAIDILVSFIQKTPFLTLAGTSNDPLIALQTLRELRVHIIFLDIEMPSISGFDFMKLMPYKTRVILTTAYSEHALSGFEYDALDYLLKPIPFERFMKAAQKALETIAYVEPKVPHSENYIFVKTENKGKMNKVNFEEIIYIEGLKNYISIYTNSERIITLLNIKDVSDRLPNEQFIRVHKSYIIARSSIKAIDGNQIILKNTNTSVPLGETYRTAFFEDLQKNLMNSRK